MDPSKALGDYLRRRLQYIERCNAEIETKLYDDLLALNRKVDGGANESSDIDVGQIFFHLEYVVGNTFRYTMLVGTCSFLEEAIKAITKRLVLDYESKLGKQKNGNWLGKHICILSDSVNLDVAPIQSELIKFHDLIALRNCVVHSWGKVAEARDPNLVRAAACRIETAAVSKDGYLVFGDQVVPEAIIAAESIAECILASKLQSSMI